MKRILVLGLSDNIGGVETFFHTYYRKMSGEKYIFDFATVCSTVAFGEEYIKNGSSIYILPSFMKHPIKYYRVLRDIMKSGHYDIVHINMLSAANVLPIKAASKEKVPKIIVHSHNAGVPNGALRKSLNFINSRVLKKGDFTRLACGEKAGKWMFGDKNNFTIINNAIDTKRFEYNEKNRESIRKEYHIKNNDILIGNIGRLCEQKNQAFLIPIIKKLDQRYKLMIIGDGDKKAELEAAITLNKLDDRVILLGNRQGIERYYSAFDMFAFPSLFEGTPIAPIEAQVNGLKCLLSNTITNEVQIGGCTYLSIGEEEGWLKAIKEESASNRSFSSNCSIYDIEKQSKVLEDVYER